MSSFEGVPVEVVRILLGLLAGDGDVAITGFSRDMHADGASEMTLEIKTLRTHHQRELFLQETVERAAAGLWALVIDSLTPAERFRLAEDMMERWAKIAASAEKQITVDQMQPTPRARKRKS